MVKEKTEISLWIFIILVIGLGFLIGFIINIFTKNKNTSNYKNDNETDDYDFFDFD